MFEPSQLALFMLATLTLNLTPGPDMLYTATRSLGQGRKAGIASAHGWRWRIGNSAVRGIR